MKTNVVLVLTVALLVMNGSTPAAADEKQSGQEPVESLLVTWEHANWSLPLLVAHEKGYFAEAGVNVSLHKLEGAVTSHISETDIINGHGLYLMSQSDATPEAVRFVHPMSMRKGGDMIKGLLAKRTMGVRTWEDFKAKKKSIALGRSGDSGLIIDLLRSKGLTVFGNDSDITSFLVGYSKRFAEVDDAIALYGWSSDVRRVMEEKPNSYVLLGKNLECEAMANPYYVACTYVNVKACATKQESLRRYISAIDKAIGFVRQHPRKALEIVPHYSDWQPEEAALFGVYHYDKSAEEPDFNAIQKARDKDLREFWLESLSGQSPQQTNAAGEPSIESRPHVLKGTISQQLRGWIVPGKSLATVRVPLKRGIVVDIGKYTLQKEGKVLAECIGLALPEMTSAGITGNLNAGSSNTPLPRLGLRPQKTVEERTTTTDVSYVNSFASLRVKKGIVVGQGLKLRPEDDSHVFLASRETTCLLASDGYKTTTEMDEHVERSGLKIPWQDTIRLLFATPMIESAVVELVSADGTSEVVQLIASEKVRGTSKGPEEASTE